MNENNSDLRYDPIVEILRLAYRRGLALRREQELNKAALSDNPGGVDKKISQPNPSKSEE